MIFTILALMVVAYAVYHFLIAGPPGAVLGGIKGAYHWLVGLSVLTILTYLLKIVWWGLVILSLDIATPPYGIDIESLFAFPIATYFRTAFEWSVGWAFGIAYAIVFAAAISVLLFHWFVYRKWVG